MYKVGLDPTSSKTAENSIFIVCFFWGVVLNFFV